MTFHIRSDWLRVEDAPAGTEDAAEDRTTLGEIDIVADGVLLTAVVDSRTGKLRRGANLSGYQLAEWLAWHWWRLRWETRRSPRNLSARGGAGENGDGWNWSAAHRLSDVGNGWLWPHVVFESDGARIACHSHGSPESPTEPLRFLGGPAVVIPAQEWADGVDQFLDCVLNRLADDGLQRTELAMIWRELRQERDDPELAAYRKIEARLGCNVDEAVPETVENVYEAGNSLGHAAMMEVVADQPATAREIETNAKKAGFPSRQADRPDPIGQTGYGDDQVPAWRVGVDAAQQLRERERLGDGPISDTRLAELCALPPHAFRRSRSKVAMGFALCQSDDIDRVVLRSQWETGRRFEAARLLGDALLVDENEPLRPATGALTYRQKMQRAFAAELLCPIESLVSSLDDLSEEAQQQAARSFKVSPWTVSTLLVDNSILRRQEVRDPDFTSWP